MMTETAYPTMGMLANIRNPYSAAESWLYDKVVAPAAASFADRMAEFMPSSLPDNARILDVGCGGGQNAILLAKRYPGSHVTGLDLSAEQIERAKERTSDRADRFTWVAGSAVDIPYDDDRFDFIVSIASIKHWPDPRKGLREVVRVLKPGGKLHVVEADRGCRFEDAEAFVGAWAPAPVRPFALAFFRTWIAGRSISKDEASELFRDLPLRDVKVFSGPGLPIWIAQGVGV